MAGYEQLEFKERQPTLHWDDPQFMRLVEEGKTVRQIAEALGTTPKCVRDHASILRKQGYPNLYIKREESQEKKNIVQIGTTRQPASCGGWGRREEHAHARIYP